MCDIPLRVKADEVIVRAAKIPSHIDEKKKKLKPAAFRQSPGSDDLSVMRHSYLGSDRCKALAKNICGDSYRGFAALRVEEIRKLSAEVHDSREEFCGHAHISQGFVGPARGETAAPWMQDRYRELAKTSRLYLDPDILEVRWTGPQIK